jgi:hypothetical protein
VEVGSLSQEILFGTTESVINLIKRGANVNEQDIYGYTPLIEATIKSNVEIAVLLLENGARIDQQDIAGQTALQWAVNRGNLTLIELYLKHQANPNHYSADGQPILVNPLLRDQKAIIELLLPYGASQEFAEDFINAKLIGHRYELTGWAEIVNTQDQFVTLDYEGFYLEFTVGIIQRTLASFINSPTGARFASYTTVLQKIIRTLKEASFLIRFKYTTEGPKINAELIRESLAKDLVVIPVTYAGHAITFVCYKNLFSKNDRGVKHIVDTVVISKVGNQYALNPDFLKDLMYTPKKEEYINNDIKKILDLKPFTTLPARYQLSGNCSWANVEASIPAMMFMLMFQGDFLDRGGIASLKNSIMNFYDTWVEWSKDKILEECITEFYKADKIRKASKAAILAAILQQRCRPDRPKEVERAKKILPILTIPDYNYILKSYIKIYCTKVAGKMGEDFTRLLKISGLDFTTLTLNATETRGIK